MGNICDYRPAAAPNLSKTRDGIPQGFTSRRESMKIYVAIKIYLRTGEFDETTG
jgi:hypothetical protein